MYILNLLMCLWESWCSHLFGNWILISIISCLSDFPHPTFTIIIYISFSGLYIYIIRVWTRFSTFINLLANSPSSIITTWMNEFEDKMKQDGLNVIHYSNPNHILIQIITPWTYLMNHDKLIYLHLFYFFLFHFFHT